MYGKDDCPLCDRLETLIRPHCRLLARLAILTYTKQKIDQDPATWRLYRHRIPVLTANDRILVEGRPSPQQVARAFAAWPAT